ncbi:hypothetical protein ES708_06429 [subsurface metagenome]
MVELPDPSLDTIKASGDPGDETARRYTYQWSWAAIVCCMLLDDTEDAVEVICEHHEDILIKHHDGTFTGLQVKTRASNQSPWRTSDRGLKDACTRFARLEARFPGQFRRFRFLTNHPLYPAKNGRGFRYVLSGIDAAASIDEVSKPIADFVKRVSNDANCNSEAAFNALHKTDADDSLPKIADVEMRLIDTVTQAWEQAKNCSIDSVKRTALHLVYKCGQASSLGHQGFLAAYLPATANPETTELEARLLAKRFDKTIVLQILENGLNETALLCSSPESLDEPGVGDTKLLLKKIDAGGFSSVSRNSAQDLRDKADYLGIMWTKKHGRPDGLKRYDHVRSIVLREAADAFEAVQKKKDRQRSFGLEMLSDLRLRLNERLSDGSELFDCTAEHLEGFAYSLTSECKVLWSIERPWEDG